MRKHPTCIYTETFNIPIPQEQLYGKMPNIELLAKIQELEKTIEEMNKRISDQVSNLKAADSGKSTINTEVFDNNVDENFSDRETSSLSPIIDGNENMNVIPGPAEKVTLPIIQYVDKGNFFSPFKMDETFNVLGNPLLNYRMKDIDAGSNITFGVTAWNTTSTAEKVPFRKEYIKIQEKILPKVQKWKHKRNINLYNVNSLVDHRDTDGCILESVARTLPPLQDIRACLDKYFKGIHDFFPILDPTVTIQNFQKYFREDSEAEQIHGGHGTKLSVPDNKAIFEVAIILSILSDIIFTHQIPEPMEQFFLILYGTSSSEFCDVERAQFLLLQYFSKVYHKRSGKWNHSNLVELVDLLCRCCINLGLNDVYYLATDKDTAIMKWIWRFTLFADISVSFDMGKPLFISDSYLWDTTQTNQVEMRRETSMDTFIITSRRCINKLYEKTNNVDIGALIALLEEFIKIHFPIRANYTDSKGMKSQIDLFDILLLSPTLGLLLNLHHIKTCLFKDISIRTKNGIAKYGLLSVTLCVNTILTLYALDKQEENISSNSVSHLPPHLNFAQWLLNSLPMRCITEIFSCLFGGLTVYDKSNILLSKSNWSSKDLSTRDIHIPIDQYFSLPSVINQLMEVLDRICAPSMMDLQNILSTSLSFYTLLEFQQIGRRLIEKSLASRMQTEEVWSKRGVNFKELSGKAFSNFTDEVWDTYELQTKDIWDNI